MRKWSSRKSLWCRKVNHSLRIYTQRETARQTARERERKRKNVKCLLSLTIFKCKYLLILATLFMLNSSTKADFYCED